MQTTAFFWIWQCFAIIHYLCTAPHNLIILSLNWLIYFKELTKRKNPLYLTHKHYFIATWLVVCVLGNHCTTKKTPGRFELLDAAATGIAFQNNIPDETPDGMNIVQYLYYYNGGGVATGDVNNDGLADVFFTANLGSNQLYLNQGDMRFEDVSAKAGIAGTLGTWNTGVALADVNADGWLDIYVSRVGNYKRWKGKNQLFINRKDGTFRDEAANYGLDVSAFSTQANFTDVDNDGDLDCFLLCHSVHATASYGDTTQTRQKDPLAADRLFLCEIKPDGTFFYKEASDQFGILGGAAGYGLGVVAGDFNGDHFTDLYVANDFHENDYLYINQNGKRFKEQIADFTGHTSNFSMGCDLADFNNDALPDLITLDMRPEEEPILKASQPADLYDIHYLKNTKGYHWQYPRNSLQINQTASPEQPVATDIAFFAGVAATDWSWSALFADLDLDGWKDLYITNGIVRRPNNMDYIRFTSAQEVQQNASDRELIEKMPDGAAANYCFRNTGFLQMQNVSEDWGLAQKGYSNGAAYADLDNDGDLDLVTNNINAPASIWRNRTLGHLDKKEKTTPAHFLKIRLKGTAPNTFAIGAKVWAYCKDTMQYLENQPIRGFQSCVEPGVLYFGLGTSTALDSVVVRWPDGTASTVQATINQTLDLSQSGLPGQPFVGIENALPALRILKEIRSQFPDSIGSRPSFPEKLQPWALDNTGPRPAVSKSLFFLPGNGGGELFRWNSQGLPEPTQQIRYGGKGTCALFFDANGDKLDDLYVGVAPTPQHPTGSDHLFINRKGRFEEVSALAQSPAHTSCITAADMDGDGDLDLFAGGRNTPGAYGVAPRSYLLQNDGKGNFTDITDSQAPKLGNLGMITDAHWAEMNNSGLPDLVLCGEWMPIHIFFNNDKGQLVGMAIPESSGLWNTVAIKDFDGDKDLDIVGGNFGSNSVLTASKDQPLELWVKDFDQNGQTDPVMAYYRNGVKYPFFDKDLLASQMPFLKKRYVEYATFAQHNFDQVFTKDLRDGAQVLRVETLASAYFEQKPEGLWTISGLTDPLQWAPIHAINPDELDFTPGLDLWIGGNAHRISPAIGRLDALPLTQAVCVDKAVFVPVLTDFAIVGAVRSIITTYYGTTVITTEDGRAYFVSNNE